MAVYTRVSAEDLSAFLKNYDVGGLVSAKGIAEGVENSNYLVDTTQGRFILTLYEKRVDAADLPYFMGLTAHLAAKGLPVPAPIPDRSGTVLQVLANRPACLIEFLEGVSVTHPGPDLAGKAGQALAELHVAAADFEQQRPNQMGLTSWHELAKACGASLMDIDADLPSLVTGELEWQDRNMCGPLPEGTVHADLFPDNVLIRDGEVSGLIDFYFACTERFAYDLAIMHAAWCFDDEGMYLGDVVANALMSGYEKVRAFSVEEQGAFSALCRGAALRFLLTRAYDWINTPPGAMVTRKDPMAFARRLQHYRETA